MTQVFQGVPYRIEVQSKITPSHTVSHSLLGDRTTMSEFFMKNTTDIPTATTAPPLSTLNYRPIVVLGTPRGRIIRRLPF